MSQVVGGISLVTGRRRRRCRGRDASTVGGGEGGPATSVRVVGCRRDLSWCRARDASTVGGGEGGSYPWCHGSLLVSWAPAGPCECRCCRRLSAGSLGVADGTLTTGEGGRAGAGAGFLAAAQPGDLLCLNRTPKWRHFDARSIKTTSF